MGKVIKYCMRFTQEKFIKMTIYSGGKCFLKVKNRGITEVEAGHFKVKLMVKTRSKLFATQYRG